MINNYQWKSNHTNSAIYLNKAFVKPRKWKNKKVIECLVQIENFQPRDGKQNLLTIIDDVRTTWAKDFQGSSASFLDIDSCRGVYSVYFEIKGDLTLLKNHLASLDLGSHEDLMINSL